MKTLKIYFVESDCQDTIILGRSAKEWILREFDGCDYEIVKDFSSIEESQVPRAVLSLDMPLVTKKYIVRLLETALHKGAGRVVFGRDDNGFMLQTKKGRNTFFVEDEVFLQLGGAKNYNLVYNTLREKVVARLIQDGVVMKGAEFHIDDTVEIESGATLCAPLTIGGNTIVKSGAVIDNSNLQDCVIERNAHITCSHLVSSHVGENSTVGPFARLRDADIKDNCRIGDFVEVKNSTLCQGVKCAHLAYVGDAVVGEKTNIGCGSVFCNYDGKKKHRTTVGKGVFIGANVNLVAPLKVGDNTYIAAGTTVTKDTTDNGFVIGRVRQENKEIKPK